MTDTTVVTYAPTTTQVVITRDSPVSIAVVEAETVTVQEVGEVGQQGPVGPRGPAQIYIGDTPPDVTVYPLWLDTSASD